jgi:hypothetical protein
VRGDLPQVVVEHKINEPVAPDSPLPSAPHGGEGLQRYRTHLASALSACGPSRRQVTCGRSAPQCRHRNAAQLRRLTRL